MATNFESWRVVVGHVTPCAPHVRRAEDCPPYQTRKRNKDCFPMGKCGTAVVGSQRIRVREPSQNWIMSRRSEILEHTTEYWIQQPAGMPHIKIERRQFAVQMQLWLVIQRVAVVILQSLLHRPRDDVAERVKIEVQLECNAVIQSDALIVDRVTTNEAKTECNNVAALPPEEAARAIRHPLRDSQKVLLGQGFEF